MTKSKWPNSELACWREVSVFFGGNNSTSTRLVRAHDLTIVILVKKKKKSPDVSGRFSSFFFGSVFMTPIVTCVLEKTGVVRIDS